MEIKSNIGGKIGTFKAQAYLDGDMALDGAELNSLYTGLLNTKMYLLGTANDSYVKSDTFNDLMTGLEEMGAKAIGKKAKVIHGMKLYTRF